MNQLIPLFEFTCLERFEISGGDFINKVAREWLVPLVYGFISQANISVFGKSIYLTLIARRSSKYAGTRFLKRGKWNLGCNYR